MTIISIDTASQPLLLHDQTLENQQQTECPSAHPVATMHEQHRRPEQKPARYQSAYSRLYNIPTTSTERRCNVFRSLLANHGRAGVYKSPRLYVRNAVDRRRSSTASLSSCTKSLRTFINRNEGHPGQQRRQTLLLPRRNGSLPVSLGFKVLYARISELEGRNKRLRLQASVLERKRDRVAQLEKMHREYAEQLEARLEQVRKSLATMNA